MSTFAPESPVIDERISKLDEDLADMIRNGGHATDWSGHVGQDTAKKSLQRAAASARIRGAMMGHVLLASPYAGIGKTSLAILTALEVGRQFRIASGKITLREIRSLLADMEDNDVLIIDEIHMLASGGKSNSEWLLPYLQNGKLVGPRGPEDYPRVTIIGTTTSPGSLPGPVRERFTYQPVLEPYTDEEAMQIAFMHCGNMFPLNVPIPSEETGYALARAGANRPRVIRSLVSTLLDLAVVGEVEGPDYDMSEVLHSVGVTADGLTTQAVDYILLLAERMEPVGANVISEHLGEKGDGLVQLERLLLDKGLIGRTRAGRELTRSGTVRAKELKRAM